MAWNQRVYQIRLIVFVIANDNRETQRNLERHRDGYRQGNIERHRERKTEKYRETQRDIETERQN